VQRIPVRLQLDHVDQGLLLQAGLSASVTIDTRSEAEQLSSEPKRSMAAETVGSTR
jgi:multidrug resistance efflux pump